ncbi:DUF4249 domain-containing protein [Algoriphagus sp. AK58]|uniref:DUF4249 domain-containing protein n=1 Tax=Algoriphagus sp. AK58 TaxID=1406877 RepID=UPI00164F58AF|nr:DUF4249 domain-containing protein [Algoriphagus sp. AK58]MBC6365343.1 DUF4249 domain-containing protein [Algoriphagus sp. AK58]
MRKSWTFLLLSLLYFSCQEEVFLPLDQKDQRIPVIEALWTDQGIYNEVKIALSKNYYDSLDQEIIKDAQVFVRVKSSGRIIPFRYIDSSNSYRPNPSERARVGETYELNVLWQDQVYQSSGVMLEAPIVDSVTWKFEEERLFREEGYYIKVYGKIPFTENNNYRIRVIENDTLKNQREDYLLFDDTFGLRFFEEGLELGYAFQENDRVRLELYRLNRDAFDYLNQLVNLLFNDGGLFSPPPQNPESNIKVVQGDSQVLGYFVVSPVLSRTIVIQAKYD